MLLIFSSSFLCASATAINHDYDSLQNIFYKLSLNGLTKLPRERVYLHLDNSSYYRDDKIWFKAYIVTDNPFQRAALSGTLYVELLNPGGKIVDRQILKIVDGQCHGQLSIGQLPFYSGFYEIRAYTRYMLETDKESLYSRVIPVFDNHPVRNHDDRPTMLGYGKGGYEYLRPTPYKNKTINMKMYPEGGHLVTGIKSRIACEVTDKNGQSLNISGKIIDKTTNEVKSIFETTHNGRAIFDFVPDSHEYIAELEKDGKTYSFNLPQAEPTGVVMTIDNTSCQDSLLLNISRNNLFPSDMLGLAVTSRNSLYGSYIIDFSYGDEFNFKIDKQKLPIGVINLTLFDSDGKEIAERMIFNNRPEKLIEIKLLSVPPVLTPFQPIELTFSTKNPNGSPSKIPFSLSVADADGYITPNSNILSELLLSSEVKGYIDNPSYYFLENNLERQKELDCLMMIQGWKKYSWEDIITAYDPKTTPFPESDIEVRGKIVSFVRSKPIPDATVSVMLFNETTDESETPEIDYDIFLTDSLGVFSFATDFEGKRTMVLSVGENGKRKDHRILLDRSISPEPRRYNIAELIINFENDDVHPSIIDDRMQIFANDSDDITTNDKSIVLNEVVVNARKNSKARDINRSRSNSIAFYDIAEELNAANDKDIVIGQSLNDLLMTMNPNFTKKFSPTGETLLYKGKEPLYVIDYEPNYGSELDSLKPRHLYLESIKSIYLSEDPATMLRYASSKYNMFTIDRRYGCAVLIETDPNRPAPPKNGTRRTVLKGYSHVEDFYSPDYSYEPTENDYRRTIYWNPNVLPDETGVAKIKFYNNASCNNLIITAETITPDGTIGIYLP